MTQEEADKLAGMIHDSFVFRRGWFASSALLLTCGADGLWDGTWKVLLEHHTQKNTYIIASLADWQKLRTAAAVFEL